MKSNIFGKVLTFINLSNEVDTEAATISIRKNVRFRGMNVFILACAIIIASVGLNLNSIPVIIGAMLISPLMGPILGFGLGLGTNDAGLVKDALLNFAIMVGISICASTIYFLISPLTPAQQTELLARTNPTIYDVMIALFGGAAGMFENSRKEKGTVLSGVAIATALMPPLCTVGYGIAHLDGKFILGASYLFIINSIFIALATFLVVKYLKFPGASFAGDEVRRRRSSRIVAVVMVIIIIPSIFSGVRIIKENNFNHKVEKLVERNKTHGRSYIIDYKVNHSAKNPTVDLIMAGEVLSDSDRTIIYTDAQNLGILANQVYIREDAAVRGQNGMDVELMKGIYEDSNRRIEELNATIASLKAEIAEYKSRELPADRISLEITAQQEEVEAVVLARCEEEIIAVVKCTSPLSEEKIARLEKWLKVRLNAETVTVLQVLEQSEPAPEEEPVDNSNNNQ